MSTSQVQIHLQWDTDFVSLDIKAENTINSGLEAPQRQSDYLCDVRNEKTERQPAGRSGNSLGPSG